MKKQNRLIKLLFLLFAMVMGVASSGITAHATSGDYLLKPASDSDAVSVDSGSYMVTGTPG